MRAFHVALGTPWLIYEPYLNDIMQILSRGKSDKVLAEQLRTERENRPSSIYLKQGNKLEGAGPNTRVIDDIAVISVVGPIVRRGGFFSDVSGLTSLAGIANDFNIAIKNSSIKGILFEFDSPGGEATGVGDMADAIYSARGAKPIYSYAEGLCASAAYWLASATDQINTSATGIIGSIGVVMAYRDRSKADEKEGIRNIEIVSSQSPNKRLDPKSDAGKEAIQVIVDDMASVFISSVARNRHVKEKKVMDDYGQGGVMVGDTAKDAGLIDDVGSFEDTFKKLVAKVNESRYSANTLLSPKETKVDEKPSEDSMPNASGRLKSFFSFLTKDEVAEAKELLNSDGSVSTDTESNVSSKKKKSDKSNQPNDDDDNENDQDMKKSAQVQSEQEIQQLKSKLAAVEKENIFAFEKTLTVEAGTFADDMIFSNRAYPSENVPVDEGNPKSMGMITQLYFQAGLDDRSNPIATPRVELLKTFLQARPAHELTTPTIDPKKHEILNTHIATGSDPFTQEQIAEFLAQTETGRIALKKSIVKN